MICECLQGCIPPTACVLDLEQSSALFINTVHPDDLVIASPTGDCGQGVAQLGGAEYAGSGRDDAHDEVWPLAMKAGEIDVYRNPPLAHGVGIRRRDGRPMRRKLDRRAGLAGRFPDADGALLVLHCHRLTGVGHHALLFPALGTPGEIELSSVLAGWALLPGLAALVAALRDLAWRDVHPLVCVLLINAPVIPFTPQSTMREPLGMLRLIVGWWRQ